VRKLIFATNNAHKVSEVAAMLSGQFELGSLSDIDCDEDIPETRATLEGNAIQKADYVTSKYKVDCFADDTGLLIDSLDGRPGVLSARYAGPARSSLDNMDKVLSELEGIKNRRARFTTVVALNIGGEQHLFTGTVEGFIAKQKSGIEGFGYDPIFIPAGETRTFSEMTKEEKNSRSHRGIAIAKLVEYLKGVQ
jgi:XTP/dITP diphosphohydrolase